MKALSPLTASCIGIVALTLASSANAQPSAGTNTGPIRYSSETRTDPRPLRIHRLTIDLQDKGFELAVAVGEDPDGQGPVEALLTDPKELAQREHFLVAVNTNPWIMVRPGVGYVVGGESDVSGWARNLGETRSMPQQGNWSFWVDSNGQPHIGDIRRPVNAQCAVAGFGGLLRGGELLPAEDGVLHPRTALGLDRTRRYLTLVVVDGRQSDYSEGVSLRELAEILRDAGCSDALNLDGGGSSVMLLADSKDALQIMNRPCGALGPRPIPVMLGLRRRAVAGAAPTDVTK